MVMRIEFLLDVPFTAGGMRVASYSLSHEL